MESSSVLASIRPSMDPRAPRFRMTGAPPRRSVGPAAGAPAGAFDFVLGDLIGAGGMGMVYEATQLALDRSVALKSLPENDADRPARRFQLHTEALIAGQLDHPNIVPVYDLGLDDRGRLFYTMKRVRGRPWADSLVAAPRSENLDIFLRVCDAVAFAHSRGVIHRDLKPSNIMIGEFGEVIVMDWGVACSLRSVGDAGALGDRSALCGTPAYMPPEMARGDTPAVGYASDIYMLGAVLYEVVEGRPPRDGGDAIDCIRRAAASHVDPPREDSELVRVALRALSPDPGARFGSVRELQQAVHEFRTHMESLRMSQAASDDLRSAEATGSYELFAQSVFGFRQALVLWAESPTAQSGWPAARLGYARCARRKGDLELALSQLDAVNPAHEPEMAGVRAEMDNRRRRRAWVRTLAASTGGLVVALVAAALSFGMIVRSKNLALGLQKEEIVSHLESVRRSDREGLANLIVANHRTGNHEAVLAAALRLQESYAFPWGGRQDLADPVRIAAWMDPYRGAACSAVRHPMRLILSPDGGRLFVVGTDEVVEMDCAGMKVTRRTALPGSSKNPWLVDVGSQGGLWCARGLQVLRHDGRDWARMVSLPAPSDGGIGRGGQTDPGPARITGLLVSKGESALVLAVDGSMVIRLDLEDGRWKTVHGLEAESIAPTSTSEGCRLSESPDGRWLAWCPGHHRSWANLIGSDSMAIRAYFFNRRIPITEFMFSTDSSHLSVATEGGAVFRASIDAVATNSLLYDDHRWAPSLYGEWTVPVSPASMAARSPNGRWLAMASADGGIWAGDPRVDVGRKRAVRVVPRGFMAIAVDDRSCVYGLSGDGWVRSYDLRTFSLEQIQTDRKVRSLVAGDVPDCYLAVCPVEGEGDHLGVLEIGPDSVARWTTTVKTANGHAALDPRGRYLAHIRSGAVWVRDRQSGEDRLVTPPPEKLEEYGVSFSPDGEWLIVGANWSTMLAVLRRDTWEPSLRQSGRRMIAAMPWVVSGRMKLLTTQWDGSLSRWDVAEGRKEWTVRPASVSGTTPSTTVIPAASGGPVDSFWFNDYDGRFERARLTDGAVLGSCERWHGAMHREIAVHPGAPVSAFLMPGRGGSAVLVLNSDLLPVSTDDIAMDGCRQLCFSSDASGLAVLRDGQMSRVALPGWEDVRRVTPILDRILGGPAGREASDGGVR
jgi:hypothetical protein